MSLTTKKADGLNQIDKKGAFCQLLKKLPKKTASVKEIMGDFDNAMKKEDPVITGSALSNAHGDWYEWILAITCWNYYAESPKGSKSYLALKLPNVTQFDCMRLYKQDLLELIVDLRQKVKDTASVQLITSNPDFVIINTKKIKPDVKFDVIEEITKEKLTLMDEAYKSFIGLCDFNDIIGYFAVKFSFRPDRRLQIPHEASLMKALYTHMQTRKWIISPQGLKYYAIAATVGEADRKALKTVATHSITTVQSLPQSAVDAVFEVDSIKQAMDAFDQILS